MCRPRAGPTRGHDLVQAKRLTQLRLSFVDLQNTATAQSEALHTTDQIRLYLYECAYGCLGVLVRSPIIRMRQQWSDMLKLLSTIAPAIALVLIAVLLLEPPSLSRVIACPPFVSCRGDSSKLTLRHQ